MLKWSFNPTGCDQFGLYTERSSSTTLCVRVYLYCLVAKSKTWIPNISTFSLYHNLLYQPSLCTTICSGKAKSKTSIRYQLETPAAATPHQIVALPAAVTHHPIPPPAAAPHQPIKQAQDQPIKPQTVPATLPILPLIQPNGINKEHHQSLHLINWKYNLPPRLNNWRCHLPHHSFIEGELLMMRAGVYVGGGAVEWGWRNRGSW